MISRSVGCQSFEISDERTEATFPVRMLYPSSSPERLIHVGPYELRVAVDGAIEPGRFPLVIFSHGTGGTSLTHRDTALDLARNGYVVALPDHPGNNRADNTLADTLANLQNRPRLISSLIEWATERFGSHLLPNRVAIVGHSLGGYTGLAAAGGVPTVSSNEPMNERSMQIDVPPETRICALVLLAPTTPWFQNQGALQRVRIPILMFTGENDEHTPAWHAEIVKQGVHDARQIDHRTIANAGHFAFQSPYPAEMHRASFPPAHDPPGFDRKQFNAELNVAIVTFLDRTLAKPLAR